MTVLAQQPAVHIPQRNDRVLPLEAGDHLTRAEFERRYSALPNVKNAELVDGVVFMPSPVGNTHSSAHAAIVGWLFAYCAATRGVRLGDNVTVRLDATSEVQPDACLRLDKGGRSRVDADDFIAGAPELVVEVAANSASYDLARSSKRIAATACRSTSCGARSTAPWIGSCLRLAIMCPRSPTSTAVCTAASSQG
jgi:Uma2 family endonuclease